MGLFKRKPLHERLAEEGGLVERSTQPLFTGVIPETGIHGVPREREYDAVVTTEAPSVPGAEARFVAFEDGSLLIEEGEEGDLTPLADAIEEQIARPYRATAVRRGEDVWAVAAKRIELVTLGAEGDEIDVSHRGDETTVVVDGRLTFGRILELEAIGARQGQDFVVRAKRLDGDTWEVAADPL